MHQEQRALIELALRKQALRFGSFRLKSGRESPYFFNAGALSDGDSLALVGRCYARALVDSQVHCDLLFGPAYKGIPLVTAAAIALAQQHGRNLRYAFNRKEAKSHGEGGQIVGGALSGRVVIVDDVITAGTAIRESIELIRAAGATPEAVLLLLDRQERGQAQLSAVQEVEQQFGVRCISILDLSTLIAALAAPDAAQPRDSVRISAAQLAALRKYREDFGVA